MTDRSMNRRDWRLWLRAARLTGRPRYTPRDTLALLPQPNGERRALAAGWLDVAARCRRGGRADNARAALSFARDCRVNP